MKKILLFFIVIVLTPIIVINVFLVKKEQEFLFSSNSMVRIKRESTNKIDIVPLEEYIIGVVAGEMPVSFNIEALKAQAVASRSYVMYHMIKNQKKDYDVVDTVLNQVYIDSDTLKKKWGNKYEEYYNKIVTAVKDTAYQYITYKGDVAEALFFSTSVGYTENSEEIFVTKVPYLRSVVSTWDNISPVFDVKNEYTLKQFLNTLKLKESESLKIGVIEATSTGRIKSIKINEKKFTGKQVSSALGLKSNFFTIKEEKGTVTVKTKGYGHGVGMSQYGAHGMAKEGYNYEEILNHYYTGVEIEKIKN